MSPVSQFTAYGALADLVGKPNMRPSALGRSWGSMMGTSGLGAACILARISSGSVSCTCQRGREAFCPEPSDDNLLDLEAERLLS